MIAKLTEIQQVTSSKLESNPDEEAGWLQAIANGDRLSFRLLHQRFETILFATIYKVLNHREDSEDVLQEVFAQIWAKAHQYDLSKGKALTWANTMARNRAIDRYRSKQRRALLRDRYEGHVSVTGKQSSDQTETEIRLKETKQVLSSAIYELTPHQREAIELAYFSEMTQRQVAEKVGQEVGTIKARIRRGIQRLGKTVPHKL